MSLLWSVVLALGGLSVGAAAALVSVRRRGSRAGSASPGATDYFEQLFEHAPVAVVLSDRAGHIRRVNRRFTALFGFSQAEVAERCIDDLIVPPELLPEARDATQFAAHGVKEIPKTVRRRKDGTLANVSVHCTSLALAGEAHGNGAVYSIYQDITDRVRAEQDVLHAEERFRQLAESIDQVFWLTTPERSELLYVSPAYERIFGRSLDSAYQDPLAFLEAVHPDDRARVRTSLSGQARGGWAERYRVVRPDGAVRWVRSRAFPIRNGSGEVYRIAGLTEDITEQKSTEDAVHERERLLELFFSQSLDGFFFMMLDEPVRWDDTVDKEQALDFVFAHQRITKVNDAMLRQYGATPDQLIGRTPNDLFGHDLAHGRAVWRRFFDDGILHVETDERRIDGAPIRVEGDYICLYEEPDGRIVGHFGVQRDVTVRHRAEEERRLSEEQLRELANRLQVVREDERRRIALEIHDRLGQALTGIKLDLAWLERRFPSNDGTLHERAHSTLRNIDAAIESVTRIGAELRPAVLDTLGLTAAIEWQAEEFTQRTGISCQLDLPAKAPAVDDARSTALFRVLQEALTNVVRHAAAHRVDIRLGTEDGHVVLEIADDGKGLGERQTTGPRSLGIAGMRERLGAQGGRLRIARRQPCGTLLEARVPLVREPVA